MTADTDPRRLAWATAAAAAVAALVLVTAVLPAEYGVDPTGIGAAMGFTRLAGADGAAPAVEPTEDPNVTLFEHASTWTLTSSRVLHANATIGVLRTERVPVTVNATNVTSVRAALSWTDEAGAPDRLEVTLVAPDGRRSAPASALSSNGHGNATAAFTWRAVPFPREENGTWRVPAGGEDASARGEWAVLVRSYEMGAHADGSEDTRAPWRLDVTVESYRTRVTTRDAGAGTWDAVTLTLRPGEDVEFKLIVDEGNAFEYAWTATAPVYVDFHADHLDDHSNFESYLVDTVDEDAGELTATFTGRYGWYWHNRGDTDVTITLRTRGDYGILGVV